MTIFAVYSTLLQSTLSLKTTETKCTQQASTIHMLITYMYGLLLYMVAKGNIVHSKELPHMDFFNSLLKLETHILPIFCINNYMMAF